MKTLAEYNETLFEDNKTVISVDCENGRTYYFEKLDSNDWLFGFNSKRTGWAYDDAKVMTYTDFDKYLKAVKRVLKKAIK